MPTLRLARFRYALGATLDFCFPVWRSRHVQPPYNWERNWRNW